MFVVITAVVEPRLVPAITAHNPPLKPAPALFAPCNIIIPVVKLVFKPPAVSDVCKNPF